MSKRKKKAEKNREINNTFFGCSLIFAIIGFIIFMAISEDYWGDFFHSIPVSGLMKYNSKDTFERKAALMQIADSRNPAYLSKITKCLDDPNPDIRITAVDALVRFGRNGTIPYLKKALEDSDPRVKLTAAKAMTSLRLPDGIEHLFSYYINPKNKYPSSIRDFLKLMPGETEKYAGMKLMDRDPATKKAAAELMALVAGPKSADILAEALKDNDRDFRRLIIAALGNTRSEKSCRLLEQFIGTDDKDLELEAVRSLGKSGENALSSLIKALKSKYPEVAGEASKFIAGYGTNSLKPLIEILEKEKDPQTQIFLIETLAAIGDGNSFKIILEKAESNDKAVSDKAISAIPRLKLPDDLLILQNSFKSKNPYVRRAVVEKFASAGARTHSILMFNLTDSTDILTKKCSIGAIALTGIRNPQARKWLEDEYPRNPQIMGIENYEAFIRYGIQNSEKDLLALLDKYNDEKMGNVFLKCRTNQTLIEGAYSWANKSGGRYKLNPTPDNRNDVKWNSL